MQTEKARSVLVLEDDPHWQKVVTQILRKVDGNLAVNCVSGTEEAQTLLKSGSHFDLIVADHYLEGSKTGLEFFHDLRSLRDRTDFVLVSSLAFDEFGSLESSETESPHFVSKTQAASVLGDVVRSKFTAITLPAEELPPVSKDMQFLAMFVTMALSLVFVQLQLTKTLEPVQVEPIGLTNGSWGPMNPEKFHPLAKPVLHTVAPTAVQTSQAVRAKPRFVSHDLQAQVARIAHRARAIDQSVVAKTTAASDE